jgi:hypothetical protein
MSDPGEVDAALRSTPQPGPAHQCESWQIRRHPSGGRYCAACGALQSREGTPAQLDRLLGDIHLMEVEEEIDRLIHEDLAEGRQ